VAERDRLGGWRRRLPCGDDGVSYGAVGVKYEGASESESSSESKYYAGVSIEYPRPRIDRVVPYSSTLTRRVVAIRMSL
jgi:hypothetical protein